MTTEARHGDPHDFDFLAGNWKVRNRRLTTRLRDASEWIEFPATSRCEPRLGGGANIEQLGIQRGHRTLTIVRKGGKIVIKGTGKLAKAKGTLKMTGTYNHTSGAFTLKLFGTLTA